MYQLFAFSDSFIPTLKGSLETGACLQSQYCRKGAKCCSRPVLFAQECDHATLTLTNCEWILSLALFCITPSYLADEGNCYQFRSAFSSRLHKRNTNFNRQQLYSMLLCYIWQCHRCSCSIFIINSHITSLSWYE